MTVDQLVGSARLRAERANRGLTYRDAAKAIGVKPGILNAAENGSQPRPGTAKLIADFYGLRVTDIWPIPAAAA